MPVFTYAAKNMAGEEQKGSREAKDKFELAKTLRGEGYTLISAEEKREAKNIFSINFFSHISVAERMLFARNLSVMVAAGLPLARSLEILSHESRNAKFSNILLSVAASISRGANFSQSLKEFPNIFSSLFVAMVSAGEKTGKLEEALKLIAFQLKREYDLRRKIRGAMIYPSVIIFAMIAIAALMLVFVVPTLISTFKDLNIELPLLTRIVIGISDFLVNNLILGLLMILIFIFGIYFAAKSNRGHDFIDAVLLKVPVISGLVKRNNAARTCRTLGSLIGAGVDILDALEITQNVLQNHYYKTILKESRGIVEKGEPISKTFIQNSKYYPSLVGEMMAIGEETGKLSEMLHRLAVFYESEVGQATKDLSTIIEPALMVIIGAVVGLFAVSMIQPLYNIVGAF
ncbi:hypothetical protein A3I27_01345 [Candidatus Giovannonibacteria bacterium RIFCSPLOWO2_02_FULL_43_11b]|nr:MAG: hypothetical protein A3I27_01345 [Candidatus Giovannonibacteria bacterium RIFCSPLOWO2_02_FULL_43_11b]